jgi:hypothetical protein
VKHGLHAPQLLAQPVMRAATLPTLGGTAVELVEPMPPVPRGAWAIMGLGLAVLAWAAWRGRERSVPATRAPGGFRSHPAEDVMLVEVA